MTTRLPAIPRHAVPYATISSFDSFVLFYRRKKKKLMIDDVKDECEILLKLAKSTFL